MAQVVIDANIGVALAVNLPYSALAEQKISLWRENAIEIVAPSLWWYEVVSALRKAVSAKLLAPSDATAALDDLGLIGVKTVDATLEIHRAALAWAERLKQTVAYDAQYLALAEKLGAEFWTADSGLAQNARQQGARWVRWLSERLGEAKTRRGIANKT